VTVFARQLVREAGQYVDIFFDHVQDIAMSQASGLSRFSSSGMRSGGNGPELSYEDDEEDDLMSDPGEESHDNNDGRDPGGIGGSSSGAEGGGGGGLRRDGARVLHGPLALAVTCMREVLSCTAAAGSSSSSSSSAPTGTDEIFVMKATAAAGLIEKGVCGSSTLATALELDCVVSMQVLFLPVLRSLVLNFTADIALEVEETVAAETWQLVRCACPQLRAGTHGQGSQVAAPPCNLPPSYAWLVVALNEYISDVRHIGSAAGTNLCEAEPVAVSGALRVLVRYVRALEQAWLCAHNSPLGDDTKGLHSVPVPFSPPSLVASVSVSASVSPSGVPPPSPSLSLAETTDLNPTEIQVIRMAGTALLQHLLPSVLPALDGLYAGPPTAPRAPATVVALLTAKATALWGCDNQ
jgi:hypothetical protein